MKRSFSYMVLITWIFLYWGCKTQYVRSSFETRNLVVSDSAVAVDSQLVRAYSPYKNILEKDMLRVVGVTSEEMVKGKPESNLTNFLADLLLEEGRFTAEELDHNFSPDLSFFNYGGIRTFLPKGEITVGKIFELMPFENELVFLKLSGEQVQEFLNNVADSGGDSVGGVRFTISGNKATNVEIGSKPLRADSEYWLVTNDYVASGGDGQEVFSRRAELVAGNKKVRDAIVAHMERKQEAGEVITSKPDGRISYE